MNIFKEKLEDTKEVPLKPYIEEGQTIQWPIEYGQTTNNRKHKDQVT